MLRLCALINQSSLVCADANTARLTLRPYQLKESGQQSIILHVTRHVVEYRVCKRCVNSHLCLLNTVHVCIFYGPVHVKLHRAHTVCGYYLIYNRKNKRRDTDT